MSHVQLTIRDGMYKDSTDDVVKEDGSLYCLVPYISWSLGDEGITLDGHFYIEDLEKIVKHIKGGEIEIPAERLEILE